jgi:hypothetical protein
MTAALAFLTSPIGRWVAAGLAVVALAFGLWRWDASRIARHEAAATLACNASHAAAGARAEAEARAAIRASEEAAYARGVADAQGRAADTAARETETETVIREVVRNVPATCVFDAGSADALNRLRISP